MPETGTGNDLCRRGDGVGRLAFKSLRFVIDRPAPDDARRHDDKQRMFLPLRWTRNQTDGLCLASVTIEPNACFVHRAMRWLPLSVERSINGENRTHSSCDFNSIYVPLPSSPLFAPFGPFGAPVNHDHFADTTIVINGRLSSQITRHRIDIRCRVICFGRLAN